MLAALLRGTDWSKIADYLSPVLFQIVPPLSMAKQVQTLLKAYRDKSQFEELKNTLTQELSGSDWGLSLRDKGESLPGDGGSDLPLGDRLLRFYFWQLLSQPSAILDLRSKGFEKEPNGAYLWRPAPLYITWDPAFIAAIRDMYRGFYQGNDSLLDQGLEAIGLKAGKAVLIEHFGIDQSRVSFDLAQFRSSFHEIFVACKEAKSRLHPNVLGLGAVLACLYEHLQSIGGDFDVRAAFLDAEKFLAGARVAAPKSRYAT